MTTIPGDAMLLYHRQGAKVRLTLESMTNHELREILVGLWARLDVDDREDHIRELQSYQTDDEGWLSAVAGEIARGVAGENAIDLSHALPFRHEDLP